MGDKIRNDFRKSVEFLMNVTPYTESDLKAKNVVEFMEILREAEAAEMERVAKLKEQEKRGK
jgi:uncharacterized protein YeeX (DUF496 family)